MTEIERSLWHDLRGKRLEGHTFRRQHPIGPYVLDFFCRAAKLCVEVDGTGHLDSTRDDQRTAWLNEQGIRVIRFWNHEVSNERDRVLQAIVDAIEDQHQS